MQNLWKSVSFALAAMIVGSLVTGVILSLPQALQGDANAQDSSGRPAAKFTQNTQPPTAEQLQGQNLTAAVNLSTAFRNVAEAMRPSVVSISTKSKQMVRVGGGMNVPPGFEDLFGGRARRPQMQEREESGMGSGVIVRSDGYILTNNHVVEGADELTVELSDGRMVTGTIAGTDPPTDLAVIKIDMTDLPAVRFGSSDEIRVGDWVLAIGSPFGLDQTVTAGIISGKNRVQRIIADGNGFEDFLQTDAAINPGNSGGPLVNLRGELVGINTAILSRSGASAGIGFAIPVSLAQPVLASIIQNGEVRRGFLGAQVVDVTPDNAKDYDLKVTTGGLIGGVLENQPAAQAGLQPGDVVIKLDGRDVTGGTQLRNYVASRPPGTVVVMEVNRAGKLSTVRVTLGERTDEAMAMFNPADELFGAELIPVTPETARQYGLDGLRSGLIVASVQDGGIASRADLKVGDVIESASGVQLKTPEQLSQVFGEAQQAKQPLRLIVRRGNTRMLLVLR